jgi:hypothetical protein
VLQCVINQIDEDSPSPFEGDREFIARWQNCFYEFRFDFWWKLQYIFLVYHTRCTMQIKCYGINFGKNNKRTSKMLVRITLRVVYWIIYVVNFDSSRTCRIIIYSISFSFPPNVYLYVRLHITDYNRAYILYTCTYVYCSNVAYGHNIDSRPPTVNFNMKKK